MTTVSQATPGGVETPRQAMGFRVPRAGDSRALCRPPGRSFRESIRRASKGRDGSSEESQRIESSRASPPIAGSGLRVRGFGGQGRGRYFFSPWFCFSLTLLVLCPNYLVSEAFKIIGGLQPFAFMFWPKSQAFLLHHGKRIFDALSGKPTKLGLLLIFLEEVHSCRKTNLGLVEGVWQGCYWPGQH